MQQPTLEVLCEQLQRGDSAAADHLIMQTSKFIWEQVNQFWKEYSLTNGQLCFSKDDLYQEGCIGLLKAAQQYNSALCIPFLPYAKQAIRNTMIDQLRVSLKHICFSLDAPISSEGDITQLELLADDTTQISHERSEEKHALFKALQMLTPREQSYIQYRFGFYDGQEHSLDDARLHFGLSVSRAQKLEDTAIKKLRKELFT